MTTTHCFTVDLESFYDGMRESFPLPSDALESAEAKHEIATNTDDILEFLDRHSLTATFYILGKIAEQQPEVVRRIADAGHELGSHSYHHLRLFNQDPDAVKEAVTSSKAILEDVAGKPVYGLRAPGFSINESTLYILDLIQEAGYIYDSSIYPITGHDFYGMKDAQPVIHTLANGLVEFPPSTYKVLGKTFPALGGGWFRIYPFAATRFILKSYEKQKRPAMFYIHPYELGSQCPHLDHLSRVRKFRHYVNIGEVADRFARLFKEFSFRPVVEVLQSEGFLAASNPPLRAPA